MSAPAPATTKRAPKRRPKKLRRKPVAARPARRRPAALTALLFVLAVGAIVAAYLSLGGTDTAGTVSERTVTVSKGVIESVVSGSGNLEPARQADVNFATSGRITKIYASEGQHVSKGELLARLDDSSQTVAVAKAHADLVDAQDALTDAQEAAAEETAASTSVTSTTVSATAAQVTPAATATPGAGANAAAHAPPPPRPGRRPRPRRPSPCRPRLRAAAAPVVAGRR